MLFITRCILYTSIVAFTSCSSIVEFEKYTLSDETQGAHLSHEDLSLHKPLVGDSIMFEIDAEKLKKHIAQNKAVWIHFVYSRLCADAEMYDCQTYKKLNEKYRDKISYVMVTEIAHSKLARELKNGCNLVGYHTFVVDNKKRHNEVRTLKRLKKDVFGFKNKDTLMYQTNYIIINNEIVYATDQTLDKKKIEELLDKL